MNSQLARQLAALYPPAWQARYHDEFEDFLKTHPFSLRTIFNVIDGRYTNAFAL